MRLLACIVFLTIWILIWSAFKFLLKTMSKLPVRKPLSPILESKGKAEKVVLKKRSKTVIDLAAQRNNNKKLKPEENKKTLENEKGNRKLPNNIGKTTTATTTKTTTTTTTSSTMSTPRQSIIKTDPKLLLNSQGAAKQIKSRKIPEWDYKTRYGILNDKHTTLKAEHASCLESLHELKRKHEHVVRIMKENNRLDSENKALTLRLQQVEKDKENYDKLKLEHALLKKEHREALEQVKSLTEKMKELAEQNRLLKTSCTQLDNEKKKLKTYVQNLKADIVNYEKIRREMHNTIQEMKGNIRVFCRVRPSINQIEHNKLLCNIEYLDEHTLEITKSKTNMKGKSTDIRSEFQFDRVFPPKSTQEEVFKELAQLVQSAVDGYNVCVFAYGQTGSGKTYTMLGEGVPEKLGMIPRTIHLIFESIDKLATTGWVYKVQASFLEIYNETIVDLLDPTDKSPKEIRYNDGRGTTVTNMTTKHIENAKQLLEYMKMAQTNRAVGTTDFNQRSSRSHAITRIYLEGYSETRGTVLTSSMHLVDLAGSESAKTGCAMRLTETKNINKSLSNLGNVMLALSKKETHVPFRNCKLTYLLQPCLGGNSKSLMFVNISPLEECYNESLNSLRFAQLVKDVKMSVKRNKSVIRV